MGPYIVQTLRGKCLPLGDLAKWKYILVESVSDTVVDIFAGSTMDIGEQALIISGFFPLPGILNTLPDTTPGLLWSLPVLGSFQFSG